uniref:Uncharacterized protein n=1 Tax=Physcomitrium patens TaxID=3218 RepID=A0A2K1KTP5_PHYPA|nr:hypothetical protein PHYPA_004158 [Physcomitrium patens]
MKNLGAVYNEYHKLLHVDLLL